jgi:hypothetical protein
MKVAYIIVLILSNIGANIDHGYYEPYKLVKSEGAILCNKGPTLQYSGLVLESHTLHQH